MWSRNYKGYIIQGYADKDECRVCFPTGGVLFAECKSLLSAQQRVTRYIGRTVPPEAQHTWNVEVTDTFGGEANYSWVRRYKFTAPKNATQNMIVRRAKEVAGWPGWRCLVTADGGDGFIVKPFRIHNIMFITLREEQA